MRKYTITWEYVQTRTSEVEASDWFDAIALADKSVTDFGDPKQFKPIIQVDDGWKVKSVEEVK